MSIDSHLERCLLVQTAELYSPGKYVIWNLSFFNGKPMIAMENFQSDLSGRTGTVQVKSGMSIDSHLERCLLVQTAELYSPGKYVNPFTAGLLRAHNLSYKILSNNSDKA